MCKKEHSWEWWSTVPVSHENSSLRNARRSTHWVGRKGCIGSEKPWPCSSGFAKTRGSGESQILIPFYLGFSKPFWIWSISDLHEPCSGAWTHHRWLGEGWLGLLFLVDFPSPYFFSFISFPLLQKATIMFLSSRNFQVLQRQHSRGDWDLGKATRRNLQWTPRARAACHLHANLLSSCLGLWSSSSALLCFQQQSNLTFLLYIVLRFSPYFQMFDPKFTSVSGKNLIAWNILWLWHLLSTWSLIPDLYSINQWENRAFTIMEKISLKKHYHW